MNTLSREDKLQALHIEKTKWKIFSEAVVDEIYDQFKDYKLYENIKDQQLFYFLNRILEKLNMMPILKIEDFKVDRPKLLEIDGIKFIEEIKDKIEEYGMNLNKDLMYGNRNRNKSYIVTILSGICQFYNFKLNYKQQTKKGKTTLVYTLIKL